MSEEQIVKDSNDPIDPVDPNTIDPVRRDPAPFRDPVAPSVVGIAYPTDFPLTQIQDVVKTIKTGNFATNAPGFAKDGWIIVGYGLGQTVGEPSDKPAPKTFHQVASETAVNTLDNTSAVRVLEQACEAHKAQAEGKMTAINIPWAQVISFLVPILTKILAGL